jgi:hypothetical protein
VRYITRHSSTNESREHRKKEQEQITRRRELAGADVSRTTGGDEWRGTNRNRRFSRLGSPGLTAFCTSGILRLRLKKTPINSNSQFAQGEGNA